MYQYGYDEHVLRRRLENYFKEHKMTEAQRALEYAWKNTKGRKD